MASARNRHLDDDHLLQVYVEQGDLPVHVDVCADCGERYARLVADLERVRCEARADADAIFGPGRLARQRERILRRLGNIGQAARVLTFPASHAGRRLSRAVPRVASRWVAAAAIGGLVAGLTLGRFVTVPRSPSWTAPVTIVSAPPRSEPGRGLARASARDRAATDEAFLSEIEAALAAERISELEALDAFTPRVREIALNIR